jgi:hypothetical protein
VEPSNPGAWGWHAQEYQASNDETYVHWRPQGRRVGWVDGEDLYLEPEASYAAAQELARDQGDGLPVSPRTLHRRLHERGLLVAVEAQGGKTRYAVRRTLEGRRRDVLCLRADALSPSASAPSAPIGPNPQPEGDLRGRTPPDGVRQGAGECATGAPRPGGVRRGNPNGEWPLRRIGALGALGNWWRGQPVPRHSAGVDVPGSGG